MTAYRIAIGLIGLWVLLFVAAFVHFHLAAPTGVGVLRGANRLVIFLAWQAAAVVPALSVWLLARRHGPSLKAPVRRSAHLPIIVSALAWLTIGGLVLWVRYSG